MLGAILPLHDVRYHSDIGQAATYRVRILLDRHRAPTSSLAARQRARNCHFTDEQSSSRTDSISQPIDHLIRRSLDSFDQWTEPNDPSWWSQTGSNRRPPACKAGALPTELWPRSDDRGQTTEDKIDNQPVVCRPSAVVRQWWAWEDLNFRPHAYQARALTS